MKLIIAEKPNVAKELKNALEPGASFVKTGGFGYFKGNKFIIACSLGHIVVQKQPKEIDEDYGSFSFEHLPFPIRPIPLKIGEHPAKGYYNTLRDVILKEKYDEIIVATDPDREGQGIYERIKAFMKGFPQNILETRMWIKEWTNEGLRNAFLNRVPNAEYKSLGDAAECRAYDDYCFGMNGTVACSTRFNKFLSAGRVQTPVTAILVARENEIAHFKPELYQAVALVVGSDEPGKSVELKHKTDRHLSETEADALYGALLPCRSVQLAVSEKESKKKPLKLAGQTDFLQVMNKKYGYNAEKTSDLLQTLYQDKKLTTYPGTEAHEISESAAKEALKPLRNLVGKVSPEMDALINPVFKNGWSIAKHCVTNKELAHEAITPVFGSVSAEVIQGLTEAERNCYLEVIKRYLQAFYPPAVFRETEISTVAAGETFTASGKVLVSEGYLKVDGKGEDNVIPHVTDKNRYPVLEIKNEEKETKPPARYTEATLLEAMKNAGRFVDDKHYSDILKSEEVAGIGTGRTRPVILKTLKKHGYYSVRGKSIYASQMAMELIGLLPKDIFITSPIMTAMLEEDLKLVEEGRKSKEQHMDETDKKVVEMIESIRNVQGSMSAYDDKDILCKCPKCGGDVLVKPFKTKDGKALNAFVCSEKCGVALFENDKFFASLGKKLGKPQAKELLTKGKTTLSGLVSKTSGKQYDLSVKLNISETGISYETELPKPAVLCKCPRCSADIIEGPKAFSCSANCGIVLYKKDKFFAALGKKMTTTYAKSLLTKGQVPVEGIVSQKTGRKYDAVVKVDFSGQWPQYTKEVLANKQVRRRR